jgi:hypothetical protein
VRVSAAILIGVLTLPIATAMGQFGAAKQAAQKAAAQSNAQTTAMQQPTATQAGGGGGTKTAGAPQNTKAPAAAGTKTGAAGTKTGAAPAQGARGLTVASTPERAADRPPPVIMREVFDYAAGGRRDPFVSLLTTDELRPTVADLRLVGVLYDESGRRPVAIMRDILSNTQYRVTTGMTLGRMRVAAIRRRSVVFSIEEFGTNRQDSLVLGDTTKVRAR